MRQAGLPSEHPRAAAFARLCRRMRRLPRHLGQHSGGMILCQGDLTGIVPLENASMAGRVVAQWDKDDCEGLGIIKVDLLGLGMMAVLQDTLELTTRRGRPVDLARLPEDDPDTFGLLQRADTIGVFQVESRAQMATLPRMKPACFYDLVVEVALIRPGPIQGDLAHPYLRRRGGLESVSYLDPRLEPILQRTLGVPLFQEQMLEIAMVMADFSGDEAENLRKALSFHRSDEKMAQATVKLREAMARKGVAPNVIDSIAKTVGSFALYGFPESHAISFALLAYASAYLKVHRAPEFYAALLNNQPMGFYSPATLVRDAKEHGVAVRAVCAARSDWQTRVDSDGTLRLGLQLVQGLPVAQATSLLEERARNPFASLDDLKARTSLGPEALRALASIGALNAWSTDRRAALWQAERPLRREELGGSRIGDDLDGPGLRGSPLRPMSPEDRLAADYATLRLTTGPHPMALRRASLQDTVWRSDQLREAPEGARIRVAGQVICRQRPGTAKGVCFLSLEDETGITNAIVSPELFEAERLRISTEPFLLVEGLVQRRHGTVHVRALRLERLPDHGIQTAASHDFA
jgi:error-prone DNA polymerase